MKIMIATPALRHAFRTLRSRIPGRSFEIIAPPLLAAALVASALFLGQLGLPHWTSRIAEEFDALASRPLPPELPAEWRWQRPIASFDHMHMTGRSGNRLDWIRASGRADR